MDLGNLAKAMAPIQEAMRKASAERTDTVLEGRAGGGAVTVRIGGDLTVRGLRIAPAAAGGDVHLLEDLISAALGDALRQHRERFGATPEEQLGRVFKNADMGGMMGMMGGLMPGR
jgi:DNA-binding YbaB/EbfC family protein